MTNSLSRHRRNKNKPSSPLQLFAVLEEYQERIEAIVYCRSEGSDDVYDQLKRTTPVTNDIVKDIMSTR